MRRPRRWPSATSTVTEGNTGTVNAVFTVTLTGLTGQTVTVNYATAAGTASSAANDYTAIGGTLTFAPGVTTQQVMVSVRGDTLDEGAAETFNVNLSSASNASISDSSGVGTITDDDDPPPALAIGNATVTEGNSGTVNAVFTVTLTGATTQTVTVNYATATVSGGASSSTDYTSKSGSLTFLPGGATSQQITVAVNGDTLDEANETFNVNLSNAVIATISDSQGSGTITDDDAAPGIVINNVSVTEGNSGTQTMTFTVTLSQASGQAVSVNYATANNTATGGTFTGDYVTENGNGHLQRGRDDRHLHDQHPRRQHDRGKRDVLRQSHQPGQRDHHRQSGGGNHHERRLGRSLVVGPVGQSLIACR